MRVKTFRIRIFAGLCAALSVGACASFSNAGGFDAYGYLSPAPTGEGEFIGNYETRAECDAAAEAWMSRQVVGNPVSAECYPVDRR